ncbi:TPA: hypothetical protein ACJJ8S_001784, partial [Neisseria meningitidis]
LDSRLRGNDGGGLAVFPGKYLQFKIPSLPRKQTKNLKSRHSRKSGNLVYPASAISDTFPHASISSFLRFQSLPITPWFFISRFPPARE